MTGQLTMKAWRKAVGFDLFAQIGNGDGRDQRSESVLRWLLQTIMPDECHDLTHVLIRMSRQMTEANKGFRGSMYSASAERVAETARSAEWQATSITRRKEGAFTENGWSLKPAPGITLTLFSARRDEAQGVVISFAFDNAERCDSLYNATDKFIRDLRGMDANFLSMMEVAWSNVLLIKGLNGHNVIFRSDDRPLLGDRVTVANGTVCITPLAEEALVVYRHECVVDGVTTPTLAHPLRSVFASVGAFSLVLCRRRGVRDSDGIEIIRDRLLPIAPPVVDDRYYDDEGIDEPRGYPDSDPGDW